MGRSITFKQWMEEHKTEFPGLYAAVIQSPHWGHYPTRNVDNCIVMFRRPWGGMPYDEFEKDMRRAYARWRDERKENLVKVLAGMKEAASSAPVLPQQKATSQVNRVIRLKIKEVAQQKGFSMSRLSRQANMAYKTIQTIWRDPYHEVTTTTLDKLARALEVHPSELMEYISEDVT